MARVLGRPGIEIDEAAGRPSDHLPQTARSLRIDAVHGTATRALEAAGLSEQTMSQENVEIVRGVSDVFDGMRGASDARERSPL